MKASLEVCIDNAAAIKICEAGKVDRIELCSALELGGLTPSVGLMQAASQSNIPVYAMIRPTTGAFTYDKAAVDCMIKDIQTAKDLGLAGVVLGAATPNLALDLAVLTELCCASEGMGKTLHRVIDIVNNPFEAIDQAIDLGFERILTSGSQLTIMQGLDQLAKMQAYSMDLIEIMAGSGVSADNVRELLLQTNIKALHSSCSSKLDVNAQAVEFGFASQKSSQTSLKKIRALQQFLV